MFVIGEMVCVASPWVPAIGRVMRQQGDLYDVQFVSSQFLIRYRSDEIQRAVATFAGVVRL